VTTGTFNTTLKPTSFGFWDSDPIFQFDADRMVVFVLRSLGEDILNVSLTKKIIWNFFENATREFQGFIIEYQAKSNLASILGMPTGSIDVNNPLNPNNINLTNVYVQPNLEFLDRMSEAYGNLIGIGATQDTYSGSISLEIGRQDYNLRTELVDDHGNSIYGLQPSGSVGKMAVHDVFHVSPINYLYSGQITAGALNSELVGLGASSGASTHFQVLPVFEDVLRGGALKLSQKVRRSQYSYKISGKNLRIFPIPTNITPGVNDKLWVRVGFKQGPLPSLADTLLTTGTGGIGSYRDDAIFGASNPANIPYGLISYKTLNPWARNWIAQYTLALCKELLGNIRGKFKSIPFGDKEVTLNGEDLVSQAREDKEKLMTGLKEKLESLTFDKLAEMEATRAEMMVKQLGFIPVPPSVAISMR
jgi:hypothetical protein